MNIVLLTTDTTHHKYFAWRLNERFPLRAVFLETRSARPRFDTSHPFELQRDQYEREELLADCSQPIQVIAETHSFDSMNDAPCIRLLRDLAPEVVMVFGTGKLSPSVIETATAASFNLHGGNPEEYRGLDSHLWTIYHCDYDNLVSTLHCVDIELDTGDIILQTRLALTQGTQLHELRAISTRELLGMSQSALHSLQSSGRLETRRQMKRGRYYSFMPAVLKEECVSKFARHVARL